MSIIKFEPLDRLHARENLYNFINEVKKIFVFGNDIKWESPTWDITNHIERRGVKHNVNLIFSNYESNNIKNIDKRIIMPMPFLDAAKAIICYMHSRNESKQIKRNLAALRVLEKSIRDTIHDNDICISRITSGTMRRAVELLNNYSQPYDPANGVEQIINILNNFNMIETSHPWKNPFRNIEPITRRTDEKAHEKNLNKRPSDESIKSIARIFFGSDHSIDRLITSIALIQIANPCRIGEVLTMPSDAEVDNIFGEGSGYALRITPEKSKMAGVKQIVPSYIELVKEAIKRIKILTNEARRIALWYENQERQMELWKSNNPDKEYKSYKIYLPKNFLEYKNYNFISTDIACFLLDMNNSNFSTYCRQNNVRIITGNERYSFITRNGINSKHGIIELAKLGLAIRKSLPHDFPYMNKELKLKYSDAMFVVPINFFHRTGNIRLNKVMFQPVHYSIIQAQYGCNNCPSIFDYNNMKEPDGSRISFNTHSPRYLQNTIANMNYVPELFIALWSGRECPEQNKHYDTRSHEEINSDFSNITKDLNILPHSSKDDIEIYKRTDYISTRLNEYGSFHVTDAGWCKHDFTMAPCRKHGDHTCCSEHLYLKGDPRNNLLKIALEEEILMLNYVKSQDVENYGVDTWLEYHKQRFNILSEIVKVLENDSIPNGTFFRLNLNNEFSLQRIALYKKTLSFNSTSNSIDIIFWGQYESNNGTLQLIDNKQITGE